MDPRSVAPPSPPAQDGPEYPRGLIPPTRRGRSQRLLGDVIVDMGFARREAVEKAVAEAREQRRTTGQVLTDSGLVRRDQLARALAERFGVDYIDLSVFDIDMGAVNLVDGDVARRYQAVPVGFLADRTVLLAMADPTNVITLDEMAMITGMKIRPAAAAPDDIAARSPTPRRSPSRRSRSRQPMSPARSRRSSGSSTRSSPRRCRRAPRTSIATRRPATCRCCSGSTASSRRRPRWRGT
jgi:hypothetical protein